MTTTQSQTQTRGAKALSKITVAGKVPALIYWWNQIGDTFGDDLPKNRQARSQTIGAIFARYEGMEVSGNMIHEAAFELIRQGLLKR